ncbi:hypothetical protein C8R44DRAFT_873684 [Mycena epipterygia]|nr:hypothetical protein C8R44DRAFT_873684 [Mycena epipterygia]
MSQLIFVTGASDFLGSHVVLQLLEKGYRVRVVPCGAKADFLKSSYSSYGDHFEVVRIADISHDQCPEALVGVDAVVHPASPLAGRAEPAALLASAVEGTLNVLVQAEKAGIKRIVVTSSIATVQNPHDSFTDQDWNPVTREIAFTSTNEMVTCPRRRSSPKSCCGSRQAPARQCDHPCLTRPFSTVPLRRTPIPPPDFNALSTNVIFYNYLFPDGPRPRIALAPTAEVGRKRIIVGSPYGWPFQKIVDFIAAERPTLKGRLITATPEVKPLDVLPLDFGRIEQVLGMKITDFHATEQMHAPVKVEDQWRSAGYAIKTPPTF